MSQTHTTIVQLSPLLANQIAAGEVIERPSSVVKELIENAIDAKARRIEIDLEEAGITSIIIRDDGLGIAKVDLPLALSRHATSKLKTVEDLFNIMTLGFRGEALASIASVSDLVLKSKPKNQDLAYSVEVKGSQREPIVKACSHPDGTSILVSNLFFNTPARRKFLKSSKTELGAIETMVKAMALSHFEIGFTLRNNNKTILQLSPTQSFVGQEQRIAKVLGSKFIENAKHIHFEAIGLKLTAWVGTKPTLRRQNDAQFIFVNGRYIKDKVINHAIKCAFQSIIEEGTYPSIVLYLQVHPKDMDVNVHPTKHEIRFTDQRSIHDFVQTSVAKALNVHDVATNLNHDQTPQPASLLSSDLSHSFESIADCGSSNTLRALSPQSCGSYEYKPKSLFLQNKFYQKGTSDSLGTLNHQVDVETGEIIDQDGYKVLEAKKEALISWGHYGIKIGQFLICQLGEVDVAYVFELNAFAKYVFSLQTFNESTMIPESCDAYFLLIPQQIAISKTQMQRFKLPGVQKKLLDLGFEFAFEENSFLPDSFKVLQVPSVLKGMDLNDHFESFIDHVRQSDETDLSLLSPLLGLQYLQTLDQNQFVTCLNMAKGQPFVRKLLTQDLQAFFLKKGLTPIESF